MKFGLSERDFQFVESLVILPLKNAGAKVWIFGSRARGDQKPFSDIDVLFELDNVPSGLLGKISENIEESRISYKIDLVNLKDVASSYRGNILRDRVQL